MDDQNNGQYSRLPKLEDLVDICRHLNEAKAKYILIGGFAVAFHGYARGTKDIDFLVEDSPENIQRIKIALSFLPDNAVAELADTDVKNYTVVRIGDEVVIDLLGKACQIDYKKAKEEIEHKEIDGVLIPLASKKLLIKLKDTIRPTDKADVSFLKAALEEEQ